MGTDQSGIMDRLRKPIGKRQLSGNLSMVVRIIVLGMAVFHIITGFYQMAAMEQRVIHLSFGFVLIFLLYPARAKSKKRGFSWDSIVLGLLTLICSAYALLYYAERAMEIGAETPVMELILGTILIILTLEASRRTIGLAFPLITFVVILYALLGEYLPELISHKAYDLERIVNGAYLTTDGIFGMLTGISATYLALILMFTTFLSESGGGDFLINFAFSLFGSLRGGPAKIAVVASNLFGMISGGASTNVVATGQFTIPLMKKAGYPPHFAGAVEAAASSGGQIMPPVMGGAAFIIMEVLGVSYATVMMAALLPALLYYIGIYIMVDLQAVNRGLKGLDRKDLPLFWNVMKGGFHFVIPVGILIFLIAYMDWSMTRAAFFALVSVPFVAAFRKSSRMGFWQILKAMESGILSVVSFMALLVCANIIISVVTLTGLGLKISTILITLAGGNLFVLLFLTMICCIILGMGVPTTAAYVIVSILICPTLVEMKVDAMAAHLFVFFYAVISAITPPVAVASFLGAGIAGAPFWRTGFTAMKLALPIFIFPFAFVYNNALIAHGPVWEIAWTFLAGIFSVFALGVCLEGQLFRRCALWERIILLPVSILLITPSSLLRIIGLLVMFGIMTYQNPNWLRQIPNMVVTRRAEQASTSGLSERSPNENL
jgi:TRAP transporter 4TM/12TM fusion protein